MKVLILLIFTVVEWQRGLSNSFELYIKNPIHKLSEGKHESLSCRIDNYNGNCSSLYKEFYWERSKKKLPHKIADNGCSVRFTINKSTKADAGYYTCTLITQNNSEINKQLHIVVLPRGQSDSCPITQIKCVRTGSCIFQRYRCDNYDDCPDGSDETNCEKEKCAGKFVCNNGRCINKKLQCNHQENCGDNSDEDDRCNKDDSSTAEPPPHLEDDHFDWLKTTVYTVIGCTVAVVIFISFIVIVVFRVKMKRLRARRIARALERHRQHQGSSNQGRNPEQDPFLSIGSNSHYGNIIVNVNNGVQYVPTGDFTAFVDSPPPYHEVVASERDNSPPPPYSTIDRTPRQKASGATMEACTNTSSCDLRDMQPHTSSDMTSIQEDPSDALGADGASSVLDVNPRNSRSDINPPSYPGSAREAASSPQVSAAVPPPLPPPNPPSNRSDSIPSSSSSRDIHPSTSDMQSQSQSQSQSQQPPSTSQASLPRPARLAVQAGKIVLSADELEAACSSNQQGTGSPQDTLRPRQCHLEVKEGQIVLTDVTRSELGVQSPLNADGVVRGTGELEVRDGQIIFRPKET